MVEAPEKIWATGRFDIGKHSGGSWNAVSLSNKRTDYGEVEYIRSDIAFSQLAEARAGNAEHSRKWLQAEQDLLLVKAERDRLAADNARLVKASTYFVDRLKDAWLGKIIRDMDEAEAAFIAALAGKE